MTASARSRRVWSGSCERFAKARRQAASKSERSRIAAAMVTSRTRASHLNHVTSRRGIPHVSQPLRELVLERVALESATCALTRHPDTELKCPAHEARVSKADATTGAYAMVSSF